MDDPGCGRRAAQPACQRQGGAAERQGIIQRGDVLVGITAIKVVGAKWERRLLPARPFDFDTVIGAISSNEPKWGCDDVVLCKCL